MVTQWIQKIISCLLVMSAVLHVVPGKDYEKYIRFFCGLVLILLVLSPLLSLKGVSADTIGQWEKELHGKEQMEQFWKVEEQQKEADDPKDLIRVEEIRIGQ